MERRLQSRIAVSLGGLALIASTLSGCSATQARPTAMAKHKVVDRTPKYPLKYAVVGADGGNYGGVCFVREVDENGDSYIMVWKEYDAITCEPTGIVYQDNNKKFSIEKVKNEPGAETYTDGYKCDPAELNTESEVPVPLKPSKKKR